MKQAPRFGDRCLPRDRTGTPSGTLEDNIISTSSLEDATAGAQDQDLWQYRSSDLLREWISSD
jgi:hypothetical protein